MKKIVRVGLDGEVFSFSMYDNSVLVGSSIET